VNYAARMTLSVPVDDEVMDFSSPRKSLKFRVDGDLFEAAPDIPAELAIRFADQAAKLDEDDATSDDQVAVMHSLFEMVLFPESAERFIARLSDTTRPIGNGKVGRITRWLFEEYGMRPTDTDSSSSSGSVNPDAGTSLTVTTSDVA
jgi:hypothetical protein